MRFLKIFFPLFATLLVSCKDPNKGTEAPPVVLPQIYIDVADSAEIVSKENYLDADIRIDGKGVYDNFEGKTGIRGRGNTSWSFPKKPYKLKLETNEPLFGLAPYKTWILLSEYLDGSMLYNSVPYKTAEMLGIPYTNTIIPVEVTINGSYRGLYAFTEHKQVAPNRIDLGENGLFLELDKNYDEKWQFKSDKYDLPVMVKYPEGNDISPEIFENIKNDFEKLEALIYDDSFPNNDYLKHFDDVSFVNYLIVYLLTANAEINHPKSVYINKLAGGKYRMGIIWDFDWAYGYSKSGNVSHYDLRTVSSPLFWQYVPSSGTLFFSRILEDPHIQKLLKQRWEWFKSKKYKLLLEHVNHYKKIVELAFEKDHAIWGNRGSTGNLDQDLENALNWLDARVEYIDTYLSSM